MADVQRVLRIREDKPALQNLLQKGSVGDDLWNSLLSAEKELEVEITEVIAEANSFVEGWGQVIFPSANEMLANEKMRAIFERTPEIRAELGKCEKSRFMQSINHFWLELKYGVKAKIPTGSKQDTQASSKASGNSGDGESTTVRCFSVQLLTC